MLFLAHPIEALPRVMSRKMSQFWMLMRAQVRYVWRKSLLDVVVWRLLVNLWDECSVERGNLKTYLAINYRWKIWRKQILTTLARNVSVWEKGTLIVVIICIILRIDSSVQSLSHVRLFATPWIAAHTGQASLSITISQSSLRLMSIESVMPSSHLILCRPLLLLPPIPPSIRVFSNESTLSMRWPKHWSFSFSINPSKEHPGLISFRMDWLDLLAVQGTLKSLLQHHSPKASILRRSAFFTVQLSHLYMTTGKTIALTRRIFVGKVMSVLLNMLSRLVITFLPRSKRLLISWLQSLSAVILEPRKIKSDTASTVSPSISHEVMGPDAMIFVFWMLSFKYW